MNIEYKDINDFNCDELERLFLLTQETLLQLKIEERG